MREVLALNPDLQATLVRFKALKAARATAMERLAASGDNVFMARMKEPGGLVDSLTTSMNGCGNEIYLSHCETLGELLSGAEVIVEAINGCSMDEFMDGEVREDCYALAAFLLHGVSVLAAYEIMQAGIQPN